MKILHAIFLFFIINFPYIAFATGPSYINVELSPISINKNGDILCKTRYEANPMGAHAFMDINYGICVLTQNSIIEYPVFDLDPKLYDENNHYSILWDEWDNWFEENILPNTKDTSIKKIIDSYTFKESNMAQYMVCDTILISDLQLRYKLDINNQLIKTLRNGFSELILDDDNEIKDRYIIVQYDFGDKLILKSIIDYDGFEYGLNFNYENLLVLSGFDMQNIDGVLFGIDKKR